MGCDNDLSSLCKLLKDIRHLRQSAGMQISLGFFNCNKRWQIFFVEQGIICNEP